MLAVQDSLFERANAGEMIPCPTLALADRGGHNDAERVILVRRMTRVRLSAWFDQIEGIVLP